MRPVCACRNPQPIARALARRHQKNAGDAAANRSLRQGDIRRIEPHPDERQQQAICDIGDHGPETGRGGDRPGGRRRRRCRGQADVQDDLDRSSTSSCSARPINCAVDAPEGMTSAQTTTILNASSTHRPRKQSEDDEARPRLSALVSACRRDEGELEAQ